MANRHMKRCSPPLIIRKMHLKSSVRYHLILVRMTVVKKTRNNNYQRDMKTRAPSTLLIGM